jgi:transcriptional regulator with XRE-family HTH domain
MENGIFVMPAASLRRDWRNRDARAEATGPHRSRVEGRRLATGSALGLGAQVRAARLRRGWTQRLLGGRVGLTASRIGQIERGDGRGVSLEAWYAIGQALDLRLKVEFGRNHHEEPTDAGHLGTQELVLRLGRGAGRTRMFELPTRPADPALSVDVGLRDDGQRVLILNECWNTFGSINTSVRSTRRKMAEAEALAVAIAGDAASYRVAACWIVRDTKRNREIIARYPEVFASTFTASSAAWVRALMDAAASPPDGLGLVWCDVRATRLFAWRRPDGR